MKGWIGWVLLGLSLLLVAAGYRNAQPEPATEDLARGLACAGSSGCVVMTDRPGIVRTDFVHRRYQWTTSEGKMVVSCRRAMYVTGEWVCETEPGNLAAQ